MRAFRLSILVAVCTLGMAGAAQAQSPAATPRPYPFGLDPYKPSEQALLRALTGALVAQAPLGELRQLDPYAPSDAAVLRQIGAGLPLWAGWFFWTPGPVGVPGVLTAAAAAQPAADLAAGVAAIPPPPRPAPQPAGPAASAAMGMASALPPANNDGVWITYEGRRYVKSGRSTRFDDTAYTQVGQLGEQPVYRRVGATPTAGTDTIYLPVVRGMLVPFSQ